MSRITNYICTHPRHTCTNTQVGVGIHKRQENDKERAEMPPSPAHGVSVFLLNRDRTLDEVQAALRHEYKWARSLCCARERSHKLGKGGATQPARLLLPRV